MGNIIYKGRSYGGSGSADLQHKTTEVDCSIFGTKAWIYSCGGLNKIRKYTKTTTPMSKGVSYDFLTLPTEFRPSSTRYIPFVLCTMGTSSVVKHAVVIIMADGKVQIQPIDIIETNVDYLFEFEWFSETSNIPHQTFPSFDGAGSHNAIYRGAYLGSQVTDEQYQAITDGTFRDLFIGDYWTINGANYRIACFDYYMNTGYPSPCTEHHVTLVPDTCLYNHKMNNSASATGNYVGSLMYTTGLNEAKNIINSAFGSEHILTYKKRLGNAGDSSMTSSEWYDSTVDLMCERNVFGNTVNSTNTNNTNFICDTVQYPLFFYNHSLITTYGQKWWLCDVCGSGSFVCTSADGFVNKNGANTENGVRPSFNIKG